MEETSQRRQARNGTNQSRIAGRINPVRPLLRDLRPSVYWNLRAALEELLHIRLDPELLHGFQQRLASDDLPLETMLTLLEESIEQKEFLRAAQRLVAANPHDPNCLRILALAFGVSMQIPFAVASAQRAVKLAPHDNRVSEEFAHWQRFAGSYLSNTSWLTKAALIFDELTEREPMNCDFPFQAGLLKNDLRLHRQAETCFDLAIKRFPPHARAYRFRGDSLREQGRTSEAQTSFMKAAELFLVHAGQATPVRAHILFDEARDSLMQAAEVGLPRISLCEHQQKLEAQEDSYYERVSTAELALDFAE